MIKVAALLIATVLTASVLWLAGEQHRENCIRAGKVQCSVLPWESGKGRQLSEEEERMLCGARPDLC